MINFDLGKISIFQKANNISKSLTQQKLHAWSYWSCATTRHAANVISKKFMILGKIDQFWSSRTWFRCTPDVSRPGILGTLLYEFRYYGKGWHTILCHMKWRIKMKRMCTLHTCWLVICVCSFREKRRISQMFFLKKEQYLMISLMKLPCVS